MWATNNTTSLIDHDQFDRVARASGLEHLRSHPVDLRERPFNRVAFRHRMAQRNLVQSVGVGHGTVRFTMACRSERLIVFDLRKRHPVGRQVGVVASFFNPASIDELSDARVQFRRI